MSIELERFDPAPVLRTLKDFQRCTVNHAFKQLYDRKTGSGRFLVADEVGLGKTLVARGVIAKAIERLQQEGEVDRIDVVYVCSNGAIARQNINRLNVTGQDDYAVASRLTLLPLELPHLAANRINFVSFTPGTTFDLKSSCGMWRERQLLYFILRPMFARNRQGLMNLLRAGVSIEGWRNCLRQEVPYDEDLVLEFLTTVRREPGLVDELKELALRFRRDRQHWPEDLRMRRNALVGSLRKLLAKSCVDALEPDLIILDEFQRFRDLLNPDNPAGDLAHALMGYGNVKVLLLSATPYKMLTLHGEEEDHYEDFFNTLRFLHGDREERLERIRADLDAYRGGLYHGKVDAGAIRDRLQRRLSRVMCRTERVPATQDRNAMLHEPEVTTRLEPNDLRRARALDQIARVTGSADAMEYWKSAPFLLNFMKEYKFKQRFTDALATGDALLEPLREMAPHLLSGEQLNAYQQVDPSNARLRALMARVLGRDEWRALWMTPSLPYVAPRGEAFAPETKSLIFSAWNVVPDVIAAVCSYAVERERVLCSGAVPYQDLYAERKPLLVFRRSDGHAETMSTLQLLYPSPTLARRVDPLRIATDAGRPLAATEMIDAGRVEVRKLLEQTPGRKATLGGREDQAWYWAALARHDHRQHPACHGWLRQRSGWRAVMDRGDSENDGSVFDDHVGFFWQGATGELELGTVPDDLLEVWTELALGSPALCAARSLRRVSGLAFDDRNLLTAAAQVAEGFRALFNAPDVRSMLDVTAKPYWREVLRYCIDNDLQALLDEYVHGLRESLGLFDVAGEQVVEEIGQTIRSVLSIRTSSLDMDDIQVHAGQAEINRLKMRCRYALRFSDLKDDREEKVHRAGVVRDAFNSPFRPFILASTSIGQEGLDFHSYCHRVWHWNLPGNPVDLEQREGRVNRYKGHAVRRNVARSIGLSGLAERWRPSDDPWKILFDIARRRMVASGEATSDLMPYWIYEAVDNPSRVERLVPLPPFSGEHARYRALKRSLAVYRLAFGQPRQEDLVEYLAGQQDVDVERLRGLQLDLAP